MDSTRITEILRESALETRDGNSSLVVVGSSKVEKRKKAMLAREWRGFWPLRTASNTVISRTRRAKSLNNNRSGVTQVNWHRANDTWQLHRLPMFRANDRAETIFATAILLRATWSTSNQLLVCLASSFSIKIICRTRWKGTFGCLSIFPSRFLGNSDQQASISRSDGFICYFIFLFSFVFFLSFFSLPI